MDAFRGKSSPNSSAAIADIRTAAILEDWIPLFLCKTAGQHGLPVVTHGLPVSTLLRFRNGGWRRATLCH